MAEEQKSFVVHTWNRGEKTKIPVIPGKHGTDASVTPENIESALGYMPTRVLYSYDMPAVIEGAIWLKPAE